MNVEKQQEALALMDYYTLRYQNGRIAIDGLKGPSLTTAIRSFQTDRHIGVDGLWGPKTESEVFKALGKGWTKPAPQLPDNPKDVPKVIWDFLISKGLSPSGAAGVMGNINAESAMNPINLEDKYEKPSGYNNATYTAAVDSGSYTNFTGDAYGYGICQWTWWTRKTGLLRWAKERSVSIGSLGLQLDWLWHELQTHWPSLITLLKNPEVTIWTATEQFMRQFEDPADKSVEAISGRVEFSQNYYNKYAKGES